MKNTDFVGGEHAEFIKTRSSNRTIIYLIHYMEKEGIMGKHNFHMSKDHRNYLKRAGRRNRHHIKARSKGGRYTPQNLILLDERRHSAFHLLFGLKTFREAASILIRAAEMKERQVA